MSISDIAPIVVAVFGAGGLAAYIQAARRMSGKISTTDADKLWMEAGQLREDLVAEISRLQSLVDRLRARVLELEQHEESYARRALELEEREHSNARRIIDCENRLAALRAEKT